MMKEDQKLEEYDQQVITQSIIPETTNSRQLPIKTHLSFLFVKFNLQNRIKDISKELHKNRNLQQVIRTEATILELVNKQECNDFTAKVLYELERLTKDFKKIVNEEKSENQFSKQQIVQLNQDKLRLEQSVLVLKSRIQESESNIGSDQFSQA